MTTKDHEHLYEELKTVIYTRGLNMQNLTDAQQIFIEAAEQAAFGADFLQAYSEMIDESPDIKLRNLHAFCIGFGLGLTGSLPNIDLTNTFH